MNCYLIYTFVKQQMHPLIFFYCAKLKMVEKFKRGNSCTLYYHVNLLLLSNRSYSCMIIGKKETFFIRLFILLTHQKVYLNFWYLVGHQLMMCTSWISLNIFIESMPLILIFTLIMCFVASWLSEDLLYVCFNDTVLARRAVYYHPSHNM